MKSVIAALLIFVGPNLAIAQGSSTTQNFRRNAATIIFCGLGGAVLGLSTLSFYGKPQEHVSNIYVGLGVGLIAGTGYIYYKNLPPAQAVESDERALKIKPVAGQRPVQFAYRWEF